MNVDQLGTERTVDIQCRANAFFDFGIKPLGEVLDWDADPKAFQRKLDRLSE